MKNRPTLIALTPGASHVITPKQNGDLEEKTMQEFYNDVSKDVLARTLWGEARGEGTIGMHAVAGVILNRVAIAQKYGSFWWGDNIVQVCQKPYQFSCWNRSDPNFQKLHRVDKSNLYFATALRLAARGLAGSLEDITLGATHYHARGIKPYWANTKKPCTILGNHVYYSLVK